MSYDLELIDSVSRQVLEFETPHQLKGGTYAVGGTREARFNITYNYAKHLYRVLGEKGIRTLHGLTGAQSIPLLEKGMSLLADDVASDYWAPTEGNAKSALAALLVLAQAKPEGIWEGD